MPRLIHLNGPPGVGKSTLAALYVERHPETLDLDLDRLHPLVGGWQDPSSDTHQIVRPLALAMAAAHLAGGRDVIVPQLRARITEIEAFERVARDAGARFVEIVLMADKDDALDRFERRVDDSEWGRHNRASVAAAGGRAVLGEFYDRLLEVLKQRPDAILVPSREGEIEATYDALVRAVDAAS
ncbi:MAG: AAA family ATPase [Micropruina sp.]|uniref:AAA family ATPase n=1 Tax=Micropruina sp. TaxID=2737536 RepID=UPI0039E6519A